jgi:hypothetical protein
LWFCDFELIGDLRNCRNKVVMKAAKGQQSHGGFGTVVWRQAQVWGDGCCDLAERWWREWVGFVVRWLWRLWGYGVGVDGFGFGIGDCNWHGEGYRHGFVSFGGGRDLDCLAEWDWVLWLWTGELRWWWLNEAERDYGGD